MITPRKVAPRAALVQPRVISLQTGELLRLVDVVQIAIDAADERLVEIIGGQGSGKSTALAHLAGLQWNPPIEIWDDIVGSPPTESKNGVVVYATRMRLSRDALAYQMAKWCDDDLAEYILSIAPDRCRDVMARVLQDGNRASLFAYPRLCCAMLDEFLNDKSLVRVRDAVKMALARWQFDLPEYRAAAYLKLFDAGRYQAVPVNTQPTAITVFNCVYTIRLLATEHILESLRSSKTIDPPRNTFLSEDIAEVVDAVQSEPQLLDRLRDCLEGPTRTVSPIAASIYHAVRRNWHPANGSDLTGAILPYAQWNNIHLERVSLAHANLSHGHLCGARLDDCDLGYVEGDHANLAKAQLNDCSCQSTNLSAANLSNCEIRHANFSNANFHGACADGSDVFKAWFYHSHLCKTRFRKAFLNQCRIHHVRLDQSDFTGVKMESPEFRCVSFLESGFDDAELINALFEHCNLEYVVWERLRAPRAVCVDTAFTGSVLIGVDFAGAIFKRALMADIRWEYADLRYANLSECVFHMGSSRSGLVESPFPSHGTRTGFYTDDFHDQTHKIPEEIRKASLRGANLEGADVISTDFYLVDLRDANYDEDQRRHFQRCGAIL